MGDLLYFRVFNIHQTFYTDIFKSFHTFYFIILAIQYLLIMICIYILSQNLQKYELLFFI